MAQLGTRISDGLKEEMDRHSEVNWSEVIRNSIRGHVNRLNAMYSATSHDAERMFKEFCQTNDGDYHKEAAGRAYCVVSRDVAFSFDPYRNSLSVHATPDGRHWDELVFKGGPIDTEYIHCKRYPEIEHLMEG